MSFENRNHRDKNTRSNRTSNTLRCAPSEVEIWGVCYDVATTTNLNLSYSGLTIGNDEDQTIVVKGISTTRFGALQLDLMVNGEPRSASVGSNELRVLEKAGFDLKKVLKESR